MTRQFSLSRLPYLVLMPLLVSCSAQLETNHNLESAVYTNGQTLAYMGEITKRKNKNLFSAFSDYEGPKTLTISSLGGDIMAGIELGNWVLENNLDVEIVNTCASSCANYVFPAGKRKILNSDAVLLWHGSSFQPDIDALVQSGDQFALEWREAETTFWKRIGLSPNITTCGLSQAPAFARLLHLLRITPLKGFDYSIEDMHSFGITGIDVSGEQWLGTTSGNFRGAFRAKFCKNESHL